VAANNSGSWQPLPGGAAGSAPANYGAQVTIILVGTGRAAVREAVFDATTASPLPLGGGTFSSGIDFTATSGNLDFNGPIVGAGSETLAGSMATNDSPNPGTLNIAPGTGTSAIATLGLPAAFTIESDLGGFGQGVFNFNGSFTARATAAAGDANFDGRVNLSDFNVLAVNFGQSGQDWLSGDFTFDGLVNLADFNLLAQNFGMTARGPQVSSDDWAALASAVVPEPTTALLAPLGGIGLLLRRRRR
jgi:hypothetical protein